MSVSQQTLHRILDQAVLAPSGDNLQPWTVDWRDPVLRLGVDTSRDPSLYNFQHRASLIALGAMIENVRITALESGHATQIELVPAADGRLLSASVTFPDSAAPPERDPLFPSISRRCTNRKPFERSPLPREVVTALTGAVPSAGGATLQLIEDPGQMRVVARAASLNDRLLFEMPGLHGPFFKSLRWTAEEAERTRDGLFLKTLELGPIAISFKAMRSWNLVRIANLFGSSRMAPVHSFQTFIRSAAFGFLQMSGAAPRDFLEGGRALQRIWLTATAQGLGFQPMAGMLYLLPYLQSGDPIFSPSQRSLVERASLLFKQVLPIDERKATILLFRVGRGAAPSATAVRRPVRPL